MDINDFRGIHTIILMALFIGVVWWAYSKKQKKSFDEAANLPFADDKKHEATLKKEDES